jgi:tetrapyrrole methylase family protein/MazG family protein/ATP diphosphatase
MSDRATPKIELKDQLGQTLPELVTIMQRLLGPGGCPWDREQTLASLRPFVIEEAHEVVDAIDRNDPDGLREELGDLLLQIVFQAELSKAQGAFGPDDVVASIVDKMVRRHPHVFGDEHAETSDEVLTAWELRKAKERKDKDGANAKGALDGVPVAMPALLRAVRVGEKAARVGYDWTSAEGARSKIDEELAELDAAQKSGDKAAMEAELGDLLFALSSWARHQGLDPEAGLRGSLDRFSARFGAVEKLARDRDLELPKQSPEVLDALWNEAKAALR